MKSPYRLGLVLTMVAVTAALLCTGTPHARIIPIADTTGEPGITLRSQSADGIELRYAMDAFSMEPLEINGEIRQRISLPHVFLPNNAGAPDLPGMGRFVALPQGAGASFEIVAQRTRIYHDVDIAPAPIIPREGDDSPLVYERDLTIYNRDAYYPESPVLLSESQKIRGVDAVTLGITPFQYNPLTRELVVYTELEIRIDFHGGNGQFGDERLRSRYWEPILESHLINYETLPRYDTLQRHDTPPRHDIPPQGDLNAPLGNRYGYEYVIITPDQSDFITWGNTLKDWRKLQGITTAVFTTTDIGGSSTAAIESFLNNAYNNWEVPPVAFLILGDYPGAGTPYGITAPTWNNYCVSDNIYADVDGDDLPEMTHGRITGRDAGELQTMINKMLSYEQNPYTDAGFYDHPIMAGGWQTERWFILCSEVIYGFQANVLGKHPVREYAIYSGSPGSVWSTAPNTSTVVDYFGPDGLGYLPATPEHLTDWDGNATRINNDINSGAYILMHRDHGGVTGWGEPYYTISHLSGLNNDMYPFVFSINCLTGKYNSSSECFTERFHRMGYGALGLIAASEISYSFVNDTFVWGMFDGLWPQFDPGYGSKNTGADDLRTAFANASGKYYLQASSWPYNTSNKDETYHLFHHHGDAFMTLYSEVPQYLTVAHDDALYTNTSYFAVQADEGSVIALTVDGEIIGVADATGTLQDIPITPQTQAGTLRVTVTKANYYRYDEQIPIIEENPPIMAEFSGTPTSGCAPLTVGFTDQSTGEITSWYWEFGDTGTSTQQNPNHEYAAPEAYTVSLTVTGPAGSDSEIKTDYITVAGAPLADFVGSPTSGPAPLTVNFTDLSSDNPDSWSWDFGDLGTSSAQNPAHEYTTAGDYTVTLTVGNACGTDPETKTAYIHVDPPQPYAFALADIPVAGTVTGNYTDTHVSDNSYEIVTEVSSETHPRKWYSMLEHQWDFNVTPGTAITFRVEAYRPDNTDGDDFGFAYSTDGTNFTHLVTVSSASEQIYSASLPASLSGTVYIRVVDTDHTRSNQSLDGIHIDYLVIETSFQPEPPVADFSASPTSGYAPLTVQFTDLSTGAPTSWDWNFGDTGTSTEQNPIHEYTAPGTYTVSLTATNAHGSDAEEKLNYITVLEPGANLVHVHDMVVTRKQAGPNHSGKCTVWIHDEADQPVSGAVVYVTATGPVAGSYDGTTIDDGSVRFETGKTRDPVGEWCFEVTNVTHVSYTYDPAANNVTMACESGPVYEPGEQPVGQLAFTSNHSRSAPSAKSWTITFTLPEEARVRLDVFNVAGAKVATLIDGWRTAGTHAAELDASTLASGLYFYRLQAGEIRETRKVMVIR